MVDGLERGRYLERLSPQRPFLVLAHGYQPHREPFVPNGQRLNVVPQINETIYGQVYKPVFLEGNSVLGGMVFSLFPGVRDWLKTDHPSEFEAIVAKIKTIPNREYHVLGDPYIHLIMPLQAKEDQDMLFQIGKEAFRRDLGFDPKGVWLPETAVSHDTLDAASDNGYEFVALRDNQLLRSDINPARVATKNGRGITVIHFNSGLSGSLSFDDQASLNADSFLEGLLRFDSDVVVVGSDLELYGHHKKDRDKFLEYLVQPGTLGKHGFIPFDVKGVIEGKTGEVTDIKDGSSWSCEHSLGRWTGECGCDDASELARNDKSRFYTKLGTYGAELNSRLDMVDPSWRLNFVNFFLENRDVMFGKKSLPEIRREDVLFWAKYCELVGKTSCGWFFGGNDTPEREIPREMIRAIEQLVPDINEHILFEQQAA